MRNIILFSSIAIMITTLSYYLIHDQSSSDPAQTIITQSEIAPIQETDTNLVNITRHTQNTNQRQETNQDQTTNPEQENNHVQMQLVWQLAQQLTSLNKKLAELDTRLRSVEITAVEQSTTMSDWTSDTEELVNTEEYYINEEPGTEEISDEDLGYWMEESLRVGQWDSDATKLATNQTITSLEKVPDVYLDEMHCGDRFCRATFAHDNDEQPVIRDLFGEPPFTNEGFTIEEPDGRVSLYFVRSDVSLRDIRNEARESDQADL